MYDKTLKLSAQDPVANILWYKKINKPVEFNTGSAGTVGDITTGSVYLLTWNNGALLTANPTERGNTRIRFADF